MENVGASAEKAKQEAKPWVERLARLGYSARGIVYITIGWLAILAAMGRGGETTGSGGALQTIAQQPLGTFLLIVIAVGLVGYAIWRLVQGVSDPEHEGTDAEGIAKRIGYVGSGLAYGGLALTAIGILRGTSNGGSQDSSAENATQTLMAQPFGQWLVGIAGGVVITVGLIALYIAYKEKFRDRLKLEEMSSTEVTWATRAGKMGYAARGIVYGIIGIFLINAALQADPNEARGLDGALQTLAQQPYGPWLLGIVALGLVAFGVYSFVEARYRLIRVE
ncbi:MAG: DUF1206 domain-containing protein [Armatimonadaceae bacterium]